MRSRVLALEAVGIAAESGIESGLARDEHGVGMPVVDAVGRHVGDAGVTVGGVATTSLLRRLLDLSFLAVQQS